MITFDEATHTYTLDGKVIPSVTQILGLANLYEFIDRKLLDSAARFGTAVHKTTELYDLGKLNEDSLDVALVPYLDGWKKFLAETGFQVIDVESLVYSKHGYAGTLDRIGLLDGKITILDIKSGTTVAKTTSLQTSAYENGWNELHDTKVEQRICVQVKPNGYSIKPYDDPTDFMTFLTFLSVYKWSHND